MWISIKGIFNFFSQLKTQGTNQHQIKICFKLLPVPSMAFSIKYGLSHTRMFTHIDKPFLAHFGPFSKRSSDFNHSYFSQMTIKNWNQYIKVQISSLVVQKYFFFENSFSAVHFTIDQTRALFWVTRYNTLLPSLYDFWQPSDKPKWGKFMIDTTCPCLDQQKSCTQFCFMSDQD